MALAKRLNKVNKEETTIDITQNLPSLQFEKALSGHSEDLFRLRKRAHAISVYICAQATYFADILGDARHVRKQLRSPQNRAQRLLQDYGSKDRLLVGIIGCGHIGSEIAHCLLTFGRLDPRDLFISTRRPETLETFQAKGVECYFDNVKLIRTVQVAFICVLPCQLPSVAEDIREHIPTGTILYCVNSSTPVRRMKHLFNCSNIVRPEYLWDEENADQPWDYTQNISLAFEDRKTVTKTCPFNANKSDMVVYSPDKLGEVMVYAFLNLCSHLGLSRVEAVMTLHSVVFGDCEKFPLKEKFLLEDFSEVQDDPYGIFPLFDLVEILEKSTVVTEKLQSPVFRVAFIRRYWQLFDQYLNSRSYTHTFMTKK